MDAKDFNILKFAEAGQIPDVVSAANNVLPKDVSAKIIEEIVAANIMRGLVQQVAVPNRSLSIPRILYGQDVNAYKIAYGVDITTVASEVEFSTKATVLEPQLVATFTDLLESDLDTAGMDLAMYIRKALALNLARAEENAMIQGAAGSGTGYLTTFDGVYTIANDPSKCAQTPVTYTTSDSLVDKVSDAIKAQGVYGEDRGRLVVVAANTFANRLRKDDKIAQVGVYNMNETGITRTGVLPMIHGVRVVESSVLETKLGGECAILMRTDGGIVGQRGDILLRNRNIIEAFKVRLIMAEAIDFKWTLYNSAEKALGLTLIKLAGS